MTPLPPARAGSALLALAALVFAAACGSPPELTAIAPGRDAVNVPVGTRVSAQFDQELEPASVNTTRFTLREADSGSAVSGLVEVSGSFATLTPDDPLRGNTRYTARLAGIEAKGGDAMKAPYEWSFTTVAVPLAVVSSSPAAGASGVPVSVVPTVTFNEPLDPATVNGTSVQLRPAGGAPVTAGVSVSGATVTISPASALQLRTQYEVVLSTALRGTSGSAPPAQLVIGFATTMGTPLTGFIGRATYDLVPAEDVSEGGERLNFTRTTAQPVRRAVVQAVRNNSVVAESTTGDDGFYSLAVPNGDSVTVRVLARSTALAYVPDSPPPNACAAGASWDVRVVDNTTTGTPVYAVATSGTVTAPAGDVNLHAATQMGTGGSYTQRAGAPFALLDVAVRSIEKVCQGDSTVALPLLYMNWSPDNVPSTGYDPPQGQISTSHYTRSGGTSNLYILGAEDQDTDEYDDHVVAHEFGHFLEDRLYRADSIGGPHSQGDQLDARLAFGEGYGNAMSAITMDDAVYVDTSGANGAGGFSFSMATAPGLYTYGGVTYDDRGIYSETSVQHLVYRLYQNGGGGGGSYGRIHQVLVGDHTVTEALTTAQTFAAHYKRRYGDAENLRVLWNDVLAGDWNSLCVGACSGSGDTADVWDTDNDLGNKYANRAYDGAARPAAFWRLYKPLGTTGFSTGDAHDSVVGVSQGHNKFGAQRYYRYTGNGGSQTRIRVVNAGSLCSSGGDYLDMYIIDRGVDLDPGQTATGATCEDDTFADVSGRDYVVVVGAWPNTPGDVPSFGVEVQQ